MAGEDSVFYSCDLRHVRENHYLTLDISCQRPYVEVSPEKLLIFCVDLCAFPCACVGPDGGGACTFSMKVFKQS